jgi:hypothetical protein
VIRLNARSVTWRRVNGEVVGLAFEDSEYFTTNETATELWPSLAEGTTEDNLAARIVDRYGIDMVTASTDVRAFLGTLADRGLLEM